MAATGSSEQNRNTKFENYDVTRGDRDTKLKAKKRKSNDLDGEKESQGGVLNLFPDECMGETVEKYSNGVCEMAVTVLNEINYIVATVYRPPNTSFAKFKDVMAAVKGSIKKIR